MWSHFQKFQTTEEARGNPYGNISPGNWSSLCDLFSTANIKKCRDRSRVFKASRVFLRRTGVGDNAVKSHKKMMEQIEEDNTSFRQNAINQVLALAPTVEIPEHI
ncbi:hypothetical protein MKW94_017886 [Papaver nudicaule]|uniref:Uncharacterized protein n=1 Tax=Papaver nudicaule TaxID=74823 RepID=A0AA41VQW1_PAPNU|nr:hypothetical protein [Papaver nudicaule]